MGENVKHPVKATTRTLEVVKALKHLNRAGVTELATELNLSKSVVHNHLSTLIEHEYVVKEDG